jgi:hypothetical protein
MGCAMQQSIINAYFGHTHSHTHTQQFAAATTSITRTLPGVLPLSDMWKNSQNVLFLGIIVKKCSESRLVHDLGPCVRICKVTEGSDGAVVMSSKCCSSSNKQTNKKVKIIICGQQKTI